MQNIIVKIIKNTGIIISSKTIRGLIEIVTVIFLARYLGVSNFGIYSFVFAYLGFFNILTDLGVDTILTREIAQDKTMADELIGNILVLRVLLSFCAAFFACFIISFLKHPLDTKILIYIASFNLLFSFRKVYELIFQVDLKMIYPSFVEISSGIIKLGLFLLLIVLKASLMSFIIATVVVSLYCLVSMMFLSKKFVRPKLKINARQWQYFFKESWPLIVTNVFIMIYFRIDQLMLFLMRGKESVGLYSAAVTLAEVPNIIIASLMIPIFPLLSNYFKNDKDSFINIYRSSYKFAFILIIGIAMAVTILAQSLIGLIYGKQFTGASSALAVLIWAELFVFFGTIQSNILIAVNKQKINLIFTSISAVTNVILNLLLIPVYGILGSAIATVISYSLVCVFSLFFKSTRSFSAAGWFYVQRPIIASLVMAVYLYLTRNNLFISFFGGIIVFFTALLLIGGVNRQDINLAREYYADRIKKL